MSATAGTLERGRDAARFFLLGLTSLAIQTVLVRESLFVFHGGEIGLGLFYAVWLGAIALGARIGTAFLGRVTSVARARALFLLGLALLPGCGILQVGLFRLHRAVLSVGAGGFLPASGYLLLLAVAVAPAGALTGLLFPLGLQAGERRAGVAYAIESFGSMAGGALASLWLLPRMPALSLIALAGSLAIVVGWGRADAGRGVAPDPAASPRPALPSRWIALFGTALLLALVALVATGIAARLDRRWAEARWDDLGTGTTPIASLETPYHQVTLAALQGETSLYVDGLYQGALRDPYVDSLVAAMVATQHPAPHRMVLLAPGFYGPARVLAAARQTETWVIRTDAALDRAIDEAVGGTGPTAEQVTEDPRAAVRKLARAQAGRTAGGADLIAVLHGGPASGAENRLYTQEFFADCGRALGPGGVLAVAIPGAENVASPEGSHTRASIVAALQAVFREVRIAPGATHYLFASSPRGRPATDVSPLTWDPKTLAQRRARLWPSPVPWPPALFAGLYPAERVAALEASVMRAIAAGVLPNRDLDPIVYYEQLRRWDRLSGSGLGRLLGAWHGRPWGWSAGFVALLVLLGAGMRRRYGQGALSLASTGMAGMGVDMLLLLLYQTVRGTLYLRVGLVVALFMAGIGLGALLGSRWASRGVSLRTVALADLAWVLLLLAGIPLVRTIVPAGAGGSEATLLGLALVAGAMTGGPFPWVAALIIQRGGAASGRAAAGGIADAADNAGALCGALVTGTLLVPLLGFAGALLVLALVKALSAAGWLVR
jgi:predicted membrane-bound spermidine synthase